MFWLKLAGAGLWGMIWHWGLGIGLIILLLAAAFFSASIPIIGPFLGKIRKDLIWVALAIGVFLAGMAVGITDESHRYETKAKIVGQIVDDSIIDANRPGRKDPFDNPNN